MEPIMQYTQKEDSPNHNSSQKQKKFEKNNVLQSTSQQQFSSSSKMFSEVQVNVSLTIKTKFNSQSKVSKIKPASQCELMSRFDPLASFFPKMIPDLIYIPPKKIGDEYEQCVDSIKWEDNDSQVIFNSSQVNQITMVDKRKSLEKIQLTKENRELLLQVGATAQEVIANQNNLLLSNQKKLLQENSISRIQSQISNQSIQEAQPPKKILRQQTGKNNPFTKPPQKPKSNQDLNESKTSKKGSKKSLRLLNEKPEFNYNESHQKRIQLENYEINSPGLNLTPKNKMSMNKLEKELMNGPQISNDMQLIKNHQYQQNLKNEVQRGPQGGNNTEECYVEKDTPLLNKYQVSMSSDESKSLKDAYSKKQSIQSKFNLKNQSSLSPVQAYRLLKQGYSIGQSLREDLTMMRNLTSQQFDPSECSQNQQNQQIDQILRSKTHSILKKSSVYLDRNNRSFHSKNISHKDSGALNESRASESRNVNFNPMRQVQLFNPANQTLSIHSINEIDQHRRKANKKRTKQQHLTKTQEYQDQQAVLQTQLEQERNRKKEILNQILYQKQQKQQKLLKSQNQQYYQNNASPKKDSIVSSNNSVFARENMKSQLVKNQQQQQKTKEEIKEQKGKGSIMMDQQQQPQQQQQYQQQQLQKQQSKEEYLKKATSIDNRKAAYQRMQRNSKESSFNGASKERVQQGQQQEQASQEEYLMLILKNSNVKNFYGNGQ